MRTKIIATIGPKSESKDVLHKMVATGLDIARMNFSHCTREEFVGRKRIIQEVSGELGRRVLILQDLKGPRIRVGELPENGVELKNQEVVVFSTDPEDGEAITITDDHLHSDVRPGEQMFLSSGEIELAIKDVSGRRFRAEVLRGGILYSRKGVNLPDTKLTTSGLTKKDIEDVMFGIENGVDMVAISFVQSAEDVFKLRGITGDKIKIVSKIETAVALKNIDLIIQASDAIMIARGDLGVEMPVEQIPFIQKNLIRHTAWHARASITATQMLTSMISRPHPTRAEVSDIANAVWDGTDAVMLSDETASGQYPTEALETMVKIVAQAEEFHFGRPNYLSVI